MQIQQVGYAPRFGNERLNNALIDNFIGLKDRDLADIASLHARMNTDDKRHNKMNNALWLSMPAVAGLSAAILHKGPSKLFGSTLMGNAAKAAKGAKTFGFWSAGFAIIGATFAALNKLNKNSKTLSNMKDKHPFAALFAELGIASGTAIAATNGFDKFAKNLTAIDTKQPLSKGAQKLSKIVKPEFINKVKAATIVNADKFNDSKFVKLISENTSNLKATFVKKAPALTKLAKGAVAWAPEIVMAGSILHFINHSSVKNKEFIKNFNELKNLQQEATEMRLSELKEQVKQSA